MDTLKKGAIAGFACKHLSSDDCLVHPNCQWVKEFSSATGVVHEAHCGSIARPTGTIGEQFKRAKAKSPKRVAAGQKATAKNPWMQHVAAFRAANPGIAYKQALTEAKKTYTKKQKGGSWWF